MLFLDSETFCETPIAHGTYAYAEKAEVMIITYAIDDNEVELWDLTSGKSMPDDLSEALLDKTQEIVIHNSQFDRTVLSHSLGIFIPINRIHDTMARARAHSLPGGLGKLCEVLGVPTDQAKDKEGHKLIQLFCKPLPKNMKLRRATRNTHPIEWKKFCEYAKSDIRAMRVVYKKLPRWNLDIERPWQELDFKINDRGVAIDLDLVKSAINTLEKQKKKLSDKTSQLTNGEVQNTTQRDRTLAYIEKTHGVKYDDLTSTMVEKALNDDALPSALRELLLIRSEASLSSTAKYKKFRDAVSKDGRLRGMFVYCGASRTGRASGNVVQLQNLRRPTMKNEDIEIGIEAIKNDTADLIFPKIMDLTGNAVRGCLVPAPGKKFVIADLSNIEGRILSWLAGEEWKLRAFREYDTFILDSKGNKIPNPDKEGEFLRKGPDLYNLAYGKTFLIRHQDVTKSQRQVGKTMELACGFQGGAGAFSTFAEAFNIDLDDLADKAIPNMPPNVLEKSESTWNWAVEEKRTLGMGKKAFIASDSIKRLWRNAHPNTCKLWYGLEDIFRSAIDTPGVVFKYRMITARRDGAWLRLGLPSGRAICYPSPRITNSGMSYAGVNPYTKQWGRVNTYGGKITENCVQSIARDILVAGLIKAEDSKYHPVVHIHDEIVAEVPDNDNYKVEDLEKCMTENIWWAEGLPLAAAGFEAYRYRKE